jgi:Na+/H+-dicarboxylate symporter
MDSPRKKPPLFVYILIAMVLGLVWGIVSKPLGLTEFTKDWIKPFGTIFINSLKLIAVPLIIVSLIDGISNLSDVTKLSRIGGKTIGLYIMTTLIAITIGLVLVNVIQPGKLLSSDRREELRQSFASDLDQSITAAHSDSDRSPLQPLVDIVPDNLFGAASDNTNMLQVIFFAILFGIAMILSNKEKIKGVKSFFDGANAVILRIVDIIMLYAPIGVFALLAGLNIDLELMSALGAYSINVIIALAIMVFLIYPLILRAFTRIHYARFLRGILPAQLLAFSTSSSAATLPVTMECAQKNLGVSEEVSSFVLPLGATINMDGTSIHQCVSAVFIAQAFGIDLTFTQQLTILMTALLASIGAAAVPGAGIIMLIIVLEAVGLDPTGLALIIAIDRPLDMMRTVVNVTGDSAVCSIVASTEQSLSLEVANDPATSIDDSRSD